MGIFFPPNIEKLKAMGNVKGLIEALKDKDKGIRRRAVVALGEIGEPAVEMLIAALDDEEARGDVINALRIIGEPVIKPLRNIRTLELLIVALKDKNPAVRKEVSIALVEIGGAQATEALVTALRNKDFAVAAGAYPFFILRGESETENTLIKALDIYGGPSMASCFLGCCNEKLENAAKIWAERHNHRIVSIPIEPDGFPDFNVSTAFDFFFGDTNQSKTKPTSPNTQPILAKNSYKHSAIIWKKDKNITQLLPEQKVTMYMDSLKMDDLFDTFFNKKLDK